MNVPDRENVIGGFTYGTEGGKNSGRINLKLVPRSDRKLAQKDLEQVFINPEIVKRSGTMLEEEGCLSVPGFNATVARPQRAVVNPAAHGPPIPAL